MSQYTYKDIDQAEPGKVFETVDYQMNGIGYDGEPFEDVVHFELIRSGAFDYGNRTGMTMTRRSTGRTEFFDTRYVNGITEDFPKFALEFLKDRTIDGFTFKRLGEG